MVFKSWQKFDYITKRSFNNFFSALRISILNIITSNLLTTEVIINLKVKGELISIYTFSPYTLFLLTLSNTRTHIRIRILKLIK